MFGFLAASVSKFLRCRLMTVATILYQKPARSCSTYSSRLRLKAPLVCNAISSEGGLLSIQIAQIEEPDFSSDHGSDHDNVADGSI
jgi:hypothetical protein